MLWLKSCARCHGDLYEDSDFYGPYIACLHCGYYLTDAEEVVLRLSARGWPGPSTRRAVGSDAFAEAA